MMKIEDLTVNKLKKFISIKGLSEKGNKKELCETILKYVEQQVINEIQTYWNATVEPTEQQKEQQKDDPAMDVADELGKDIQTYLELHEQEKLELLQSYDELKNQKQKLKERISEQQQNFLNLPNILRFSVGQEVSISKSLLESYPDSFLYTLISNAQWFEQYKENENKYYLNYTEEAIIKVLDFIRMGNISDPELCEQWALSPVEYSNTKCLELDDRPSKQNEESKNDIKKFKKILDKEMYHQFDLLGRNFGDYQFQIDELKEIVYNDPMMLNIGGKLFSISKAALQKHENTYFAPLVSGQWELENNTHFIDRSSQHFHIIYYYLVYREIPPNLHQYYTLLDQEDQKIFIKELDYYQLDKILAALQYNFSESKILNEEEVQYIQTVYPAKWRLIPIGELTDKINKTTVLIAHVTTSANTELNRKYSTITENSIDLTTKEIRMDSLNANTRGNTRRLTLSETLIKRLKGKKFEIYEKII